MENKELQEFLNNSELAPKVFLGSKSMGLSLTIVAPDSSQKFSYKI
jgi:hypothetical protein